MFEWDDANTQHIAQHRLTSQDVEDAARDPGRALIRIQTRAGEQRFTWVARTGDGRFITFVLTRRGNAFRVVTAYLSSRVQRRLYEEA